MRRPAVHISEVKAYLRCTLRWFWTAPPPRGLGLEPKVAEAPLNFGRLMHSALQEGYDKRIPFVEAFRALDAQGDDAILGEAMMEGYQTWAKPQDKEIQFLALETEWEVKTPSNKRLAGRFDAVIKRPDGVWILDFKTTSYLTSDWTAQDLQATAYVYAARKLFGPDVRGMIFRFLLKKAPLKYNELILKKGSLTTRKDLSKQTTYGEWAKAMAVATLLDLVKNDDAFATQVGLQPGASLCHYMALLDGTQHDKPWYAAFDEAHRNVKRYYHSQTMTVKGASNFFWDAEEYRTEEQLYRYFKFVIDPAVKRILSRRKDRWVGPTGLGTSFFTCGRCPFKNPCRLAMDGANYKMLLHDEFQLQDRYCDKA